jgi:hypothetical protein
MNEEIFGREGYYGVKEDWRGKREAGESTIGIVLGVECGQNP